MTPTPNQIRTDRLVLRRWREEDVGPYAALQADPLVRRFFLKLMSPEESAADAERFAGGFDRDGYSFWVVERPGAPFMGIAGVRKITQDMPFRPLVDVGWLFTAPHWGQGYATEAASAALRDVFTRADLDEVVAYTTHRNVPSQRVMQRLGMTTSADENFTHPLVPIDHPLQPHVLYRLTRAGFLSRQPQGREAALSP